LTPNLKYQGAVTGTEVDGWGKNSLILYKLKLSNEDAGRGDGRTDWGKLLEKLALNTRDRDVH